MSLKSEQYYSLLKTKNFLYDLLDTKKRPKTVKEFRKRAADCLRHFPILDDNGKPIFSKDDL